MTKFYKREFIRNDKKNYYYLVITIIMKNHGSQLEITENINPHMRWNPSRQEWVTYKQKEK